MKFIILGCGSSMGVPRPDGFFGNCNPNNKRNYRSRCSALIQTKDENILIDTSPDMRQQLINNKITKIDKVFYSHMHADQTMELTIYEFFIFKRKKLYQYTQMVLQKNIYWIISNIVLKVISKNILLH